MKEKKLTDKEALKAVEICHTAGLRCSTCPAYEINNCDSIAGLALVDYCRRLEHENVKLTGEKTLLVFMNDSLAKELGGFKDKIGRGELVENTEGKV